MIKAVIRLAALGFIALHLATAAPAGFEAAEPIAGGMMSVQDTLQAVADQLRAHPSITFEQDEYSPVDISKAFQDSPTSSESASESQAGYLDEPRYRHSASSGSKPGMDSSDHSNVATENPAEDRDTSHGVSPSRFQRNEPFSQHLERSTRFRGLFGPFFDRTIKWIRSKFQSKRKHVSTTSTASFTFRTPQFPYSPPSTNAIAQHSSVNDRHPFFGPKSRLDPADADRLVSSYVSTPSRYGFTRPDNKNLAASFSKEDAHLYQVAEGLSSLRVPLAKGRSGEQTRLDGTSDLYYRRKGKILPKLQVTQDPPPPAQVSQPPKSEEELNGLSRLFFSRTGKVVPSLQLSPPGEELVPQVDLHASTPSLYPLRKGKALPSVRIPEADYSIHPYVAEHPKGLPINYQVARIRHQMNILESPKPPTGSRPIDWAPWDWIQNSAAKYHRSIRKIKTSIARNNKADQ